ncbi:MAG: hypothetical protein M0R51_10945 [Clostridia bacterium]|jgi:hypothetical protein|nr:hypothetical protein [Clostridia bacterium]
MDIYIDLTEEQFEKVKNLDSSLGMWFWNMAVMIAPYDTGNLRRAITLNKNTSKIINIRYNLMQANYIKFLELGVGPVKKYKGFIQNQTRMAIVEELIFYLKTAQKPMFTQTPFVMLKSSQKPFGQEKRFLRQADMHTNAITSKARNKISMIRESQYRKENGIATSNFIGLKVDTQVLLSQRIKGSTKGISTLSRTYNEFKRLT